MKIIRASIPLEPLFSSIARPMVFKKKKEGEEEEGEEEIFTGKRYIDGQQRDTVLLDSIASMANRMEEALYKIRECLGFNDIVVDFGNGERYSHWQLPHRVYDAAVRDSLLKKRYFFETDLGKRLARGEPQSLFQWAPNVLLFGGWNSHAQSGIGARFAARVERAVVAEVIGLCPQLVQLPGSRQDPFGVSGSAPLPEGMKKRAEQLGRKPRSLSRFGYGDIPPSPKVKYTAISEARLNFLVTPLPWIQRELPQEVQEVLCMMALLGLALLLKGKGYRLECKDKEEDHPKDGCCKGKEKGHLEDRSFHLRSVTAFRVKWPVRLEVLGEEGMELPEPDQLVSCIREAHKRVPKGWGWEGKELVLKPDPALKELVKGQRELHQKAQQSSGEEA